MNAKEIFQKEVLEEIKSIAGEISRVQSFSGLLSHQQKIQNLYEKFIFLKQLSTSKYQQILENLESNGKDKDQEKNVEVRDFYETNKEAASEVSDPIESINKDKVGNNVITEEQKVEEPFVEAVDTTEEMRKSEEENLKKMDSLNIQIAEIKPQEKNRIVRPINLDFNDSIAFISQLFNGSKSDMDNEFAQLNQTQTIEEAKRWMEEMFVKYNWKNKEEYVERLSGLIVHRFDS
ncbi:hypothetical protein [Apibacter mensalis]|uniref:hypothetical protein n=1 Tax=Apibacter mensalis TaxID=1586267 RepID=UPI0026F33ACA|nr:hypothetical protein [Apibacter mensalis]